MTVTAERIFAPSVAPVVRKRLVAIGRAATFPVGPDPSSTPYVCLGYPGRDARQESIAIGNSRAKEEWAALPRKRDEHLEIDLHILTAYPGRTDEQAQDRVYELLATFAEEFRLDPTLGITESTHNGQRVTFANFVTVNYFSVSRDEGFAAVVEAVVGVEARI